MFHLVPHPTKQFARIALPLSLMLCLNPSFLMAVADCGGHGTFRVPAIGAALRLFPTGTSSCLAAGESSGAAPVLIPVARWQPDATRADSLRDAIELAPDSMGMVAVLMHGSDWNQPGEQFRKNVFDAKELMKGLPAGIVLTSIDRKQKPTKAELQRLEGENKLAIQGIRTWPCVVLMDGMGRPFQILQPLEVDQSPEDFAKELSAWKSRLEARDEKFAEAAKVEGTERARLLGEGLRALGAQLGCRVPDRGPAFREILEAMQEADPEDRSGWVLATAFPFEKMAEQTRGLQSEHGNAAAEEQLNQWLENPLLLPNQRQELQRQRFLLRKSAELPLDQQLAALELTAREDPSSLIGQGASRWASHLRSEALGRELIELNRQGKLSEAAGILERLVAEWEQAAGQGSDVKVLSASLLAAAQLGRVEEFQKIAGWLPARAPDPSLPPVPQFEGQLVSAGGLLALAGVTSEWDEPATHADVLRPQGGLFHTDQRPDPAATVLFPQPIRLTGLQLVNRDGPNANRAIPIAIDVSTDGSEWQEVWRSEQLQPFWNVDATRELGNAAAVPIRAIRIRGGIGRTGFLHLRRILVYGIPQ